MLLKRKIKVLFFYMEFLMFNVGLSVLFPDQALYILTLFILISVGATYFVIKEN